MGEEKKEIKMKKEEHKIFLTKEGFIEKEEELTYLKDVKRPENIKALKEARAMGDLSENAEYDAARNEQSFLEGRIQELEAILENAVIMEEEKVTIKFIDDDETEEYKIVGSKEANPMVNKISNISPLALAIRDKQVGEIVDVDSPSGIYKVEIISRG